MIGKVETIQLSPDKKNEKRAAVTLNRKTGEFESPSTTKKSEKAQNGASNTVHHTIDLRATVRSPNSKASTSDGQPLSPNLSATKRGTFGTTKRACVPSKDLEATSPKLISENVISKLKESKEEKESHKQSATEMVEALKNRKDLQQKVAILESRIKRLNQEDLVMKKKIDETVNKTEKVLTNKRRHHEDLIARETFKNSKTDGLDKKKEFFTQERNQRLEQIRQSQDDMLRIKNEIGNSVRLDNNLSLTKKKEIERARAEKNKATIERIKSAERTLQVSRQEKEKTIKTELNQQYKSKVEQERKKAEELEAKLKELAALEEQAFNKLSQTQALHKTKYEELEKAFNLEATSIKLEGDAELGVLKTKSDTTGSNKTKTLLTATNAKKTATKSNFVASKKAETKKEEEQAAEGEEAAEGDEEEAVEGEEAAAEEEAAGEEAAEEEAAEEEAAEEEAAEEEAAEEVYEEEEVEA